MKRIMILSAMAAALCLSAGAWAGSHSDHSAEGGAMDVVGVAVDAGQFKTLAQALEAADLVETLQGEGPFTVFAPTDAAFAKIPKKDLDALLADKEKLTAVLTYHVVAGKVMAEDAAKLATAKTLQGEEVRIDASEGVKINTAQVIQADVEASNGVIHVIDTVLLPSS